LAGCVPRIDNTSWMACDSFCHRSDFPTRRSAAAGARRGTNMPMKNHPHPGRIVRQDFLEPLGLTVTEAAKVLGVARQIINNLINEKAGISAEMAVRLSKAFGPSPDMWVCLQANYALSQVRQDEIGVARYKRAS